MTKVKNEEQSNNANVLLGVVLTYDGTPEQHADEIVTYFFNKVSLQGYSITPKNAKECAVISVQIILDETLQEYTNDENHVRVIHWRKVIDCIKEFQPKEKYVRILDELYERIKHGDDEHKKWLKDEIQKFSDDVF